MSHLGDREPCREKGLVSEEMAAHKTEGTSLYQALPADCHNFMEEVVPLPEIPALEWKIFLSLKRGSAARTACLNRIESWDVQAVELKSSSNLSCTTMHAG